MSRLVSIPLLLGGGWIVMTMLGISIHPSQLEAATACAQTVGELAKKQLDYFPLCLPQEAQVVLMDFSRNKVIKRYFFL